MGSRTHVAQTILYINECVEDLKWSTLRDMNADAADTHLRKLQERDDLAPRSRNARVVALKSFSRWAVRFGRLAADPLAALAKVEERSDVRVRRRPLSDKEFARLLTETRRAGPRTWRRGDRVYRAVGQDRAMFYLLLASTGLRVAEAGSLRTRDFELDGEEGPAIVVRAAYTKNKREDTLPLPAHVAAQFRAWLKRQRRRPADAPVFALPHKPVDDWWKPDLEHARDQYLKSAEDEAARRTRRKDDFLRYRDADERQADLHSLRHRFITGLARADVALVTAQRLARHSTPTLTANVYTHIQLDDRRRAVERAHGQSVPAAQPAEIRATGTDGPAAAASGRTSHSTAQQTGGSSRPALALKGNAEAAAIDPKTPSSGSSTWGTHAGLGSSGHRAAPPGAGPAANRGGRIRTADLLTPSQTR